MTTTLTSDESDVVPEPGDADDPSRRPGNERPADQAERLFPVSWPRLGLEGASVAVFAWLYVTVIYRLWDASLRIPIDDHSSDATLIASMVKTITERGWYLHNPRLGAPFGQQFYDFPHGGETLQLLFIKVIALFVKDFGLTVNMYYIGGFGVLAAVTFLVLRYLRFGYVTAAIAAVIYAFLPYHFAHGEGHLYRSTYYSAPLACLLLVWAQSWRSHFLTVPDAAAGVRLRDNLRIKRVAGALAICVVIGATETMTMAFTAVLLATAAVVSAIRWREPQRLLVSGVLVAVVIGTFLACTLPTFNYYRAHGRNGLAARRQVTESEHYGLKISRLVTPVGGHRFKPFAKLADEAQDKSLVRSEGGQTLGLLGTAGFLGALYGALAHGLRRTAGRRDLRPPHDRSVLWENGSLFTVLALLFGTIGGFSILLALAGFSQVRVWNRISLIIAFFAMVIVASWFERLTGWVRRRTSAARPVLGCLAVVVLAFGLWDNVAIRHRSWAHVDRNWNVDQAFVDDIEARMPDGTAIFQLPVLAFPEVVPPGAMVDYDPLRGYLHDDGSLRWSYGAIKGRPDADWQTRLRDRIGPVGALPSLLGLGFTGLWVDTYGYADGGKEVNQIQGTVRVKPIRSQDGRFLFYDLRPYKARLHRSDASLRAEAKRLLQVTPPKS